MYFYEKKDHKHQEPKSGKEETAISIKSDFSREPPRDLWCAAVASPIPPFALDMEYMSEWTRRDNKVISAQFRCCSVSCTFSGSTI